VSGPAVAPVLQVSGLHFAWPGEPALFDRWSATLGAGLHWLQGESGSGKTTLLRWLAGDLPGGSPASGRRLLNGQPHDADPGAWRQAVCRVDARDEAFDGLSCAELMAVVRQQHPQLDEAAWQRHIGGFGLQPHAFKTLHMLSTGMRRKAALATVLASGCALTLLDEPGAGLDGPSMAYLVQVLAALGQAPMRAVLIACGTWPAGLRCSGLLSLPAPAGSGAA
jgi:ABC-type multidrug transport system ATPase subunit